MDTSAIKRKAVLHSFQLLWEELCKDQSNKDTVKKGIDYRPKNSEQCWYWNFFANDFEYECKDYIVQYIGGQLITIVTIGGEVWAEYRHSIDNADSFWEMYHKIKKAFPKKGGKGGLSFVSSVFNHGSRKYNGQTLAAYAKSKGANKDTLQAITQGKQAACLVTGHSFTQVQKTDSLLRKTA